MKISWARSLPVETSNLSAISMRLKLNIHARSDQLEERRLKDSEGDNTGNDLNPKDVKKRYLQQIETN